jgi:hypothetical protein
MISSGYTNVTFFLVGGWWLVLHTRIMPLFYVYREREDFGLKPPEARLTARVKTLRLAAGYLLSGAVYAERRRSVTVGRLHAKRSGQQQAQRRALP